MALDKQKILNELSSVINQLQNADCGCMGNIFSNPGNNLGTVKTGAVPIGNMQQSIVNSNVPAQKMGGMGTDIVNMIMGSSGNKPRIIHENQFPGKIPNSALLHNGPNTQGLSGPAGMGDSNKFTTAVSKNQPNVHKNAMLNNSSLTQQQEIATPQMACSPISQMNKHQTGSHDKGMAKFNEMFPGVMKGLDGDLNFDPMAIAIQMNPENQQKVAMDAILKAFVNNTAKTPDQQPTVTIPQELIHPANELIPANQPRELSKQSIENSPEFNMNATSVTKLNEISQPNTKDPIFPVETSKQSDYRGYNTLGQPVDMLPAKLFHAPVPTLPQTLAPQPATTKLKNDVNYSNVKHSVSKTSLLGRKSMMKIPSRSQMQHIYNQYKGSQSYTRQNIQEHPNATTTSEGRLHNSQANAHHHASLEKEGGDIARDKILEPKRLQATFEHCGDAQNTLERVTDKNQITKSPKCRNGLQDMVYTSYPTSTAWSFHGNRGQHLAANRRYKTRI